MRKLQDTFQPGCFSSRLIPFLHISLLIAAGWLAWGNTLANDFVYDDDELIVQNEYMHGPLTMQRVMSYFLDSGTASHDPEVKKCSWRPLTTLFYAVQYQFFGLQPRGYHAVNVIFHIGNALLAYWLLILLLKGGVRARDDSGFYAWGALGGALVFLLHPVQAESVAWVGSTSVLFGFFSLLTVVFYLLADDFDLKRARWMKGSSVLFFAMALLCKEMAAAVPLILWCRDWLKGKGKKSFPFWHFGVLGLYMVVRALMTQGLATTGWWGGSPWLTWLTTAKGWAYYIKLLLAPYPLSVEYLFKVSGGIFDPRTAFALAVLASLLCLAWKLRRRSPEISFGIFFLFLSLFPVSNIIPIRTIINERYLYLGILGLALIVSRGLIVWIGYMQTTERRAGGWATALSGLVIVSTTYGMVSHQRNVDWKDHWSFVTANLKTSPQSAMMHYGMGVAWAEKNDFDKATAEFELCLRIDPSYAEALKDLGRIAEKSGNDDKAIAMYRQSLQKRVNFFEGLHHLGMAYFKKGDYGEAVKALSMASAAKPGDLEVKTNLAAALAYDGKIRDAIQLSQNILAEDPSLGKARHNLELFANTTIRLNRNRSEVVAYIRKNFGSPVVQAKLDLFGQWEEKNGYYEVAEEQNNLKTPEQRALEAMAERDGVDEPKTYLPVDYQNPMVVRGKGWAVGMRPLQVNEETQGVEENGAIVYPKAHPHTDVAYVQQGMEVERLYVVKNKGEASASYLFDLIKEGKVLEFRIDPNGDLDAKNADGGTIISLSKPLVIDKNGKTVDGWYELTDKARHTQLALKYSDAGLEYPLLIDPKWRTTASMSASRRFQSATVLPNGKVLIVGGGSGGVPITSPSELYDPGTGTFSSSGNLVTNRYDQAALLLPTGKVLIAGGYNGGSTCELYDPVAGTFSTTGSMAQARRRFSATLLKNGKVLVTGNETGGAAGTTGELYDPDAGTWSACASSMTVSRGQHSATLLPDGKVLISGGGISTAEIYDPGTNTFSTTGAMSTTRTFHVSVLLPNGKVLVAGGGNSTADLYNPSAGTFATTGAMSVSRLESRAVTLPNGKVLVTGGNTKSEIYDPTAGTFSDGGSMSVSYLDHGMALLQSGDVLVCGGNGSGSTCELYVATVSAFTTTGSMATWSQDHRAVLLPNGKVLVVHGYGWRDPPDLYDPQTGTFSTTGSMGNTRAYCTVTLLPTGKVLVAGGGGLSTARLYDPTANTFSATGSMSTQRDWATDTLLPNGKVLIAGGKSSGGRLSTAELYDPASGTFSTTAGNMSTTRAHHTATLLPNGKVLLAGEGGGSEGGMSNVATADLYDPATNTFSTTGSMNQARSDHTATLLPNGKVLIAGANSTGSSAELYDPQAGTFSTTGNMTTTRIWGTATLLPSGKVLVTGGNSVSTMDLYDPSTGTFTLAGVMSTNRCMHSATLLPNGKVLIAGGGLWDGGLNDVSTAELISYTEYNYSTYASTMQPSITSINGSSSFPVNVATNTAYALAGARFTGYGEGASGYSVGRSASTDPHVYIQKIGGEFGNDSILNVSTSIYPMTASQWQSADTSISFKVPASLQVGTYLLWVMSNGVPSDAKMIRVTSPGSYVTRVGGANGWQWSSPTSGALVPSGTANSWTWRAWEPGSGRKVPKGTANSWTWSTE